MWIITGIVALGSTFAAVGSALGASAAAAGTVGALATIGVDLAIGAAVAGGVVSTVGNIQQAKAQQAQAEYQAELEKENAKIALRQGENIDLQANQERTQLRQRALLQRGDARTAYASSGVVLGSGSSADYEADIADAYDLDSRNLNYDVASKKWKLQVSAADSMSQASLYDAQASAYGQQAKTSLLSGTFGTIGDAIQTGASAYGVASKIGKLF